MSDKSKGSFYEKASVVFPIIYIWFISMLHHFVKLTLERSEYYTNKIVIAEVGILETHFVIPIIASLVLIEAYLIFKYIGETYDL